MMNLIRELLNNFRISTTALKLANTAMLNIMSATMTRYSLANTIKKWIFAFSLSLLIIPFSFSKALPWSSNTHTFIAQVAGLQNPQYANFPDLSKNENFSLLRPYHRHAAAPNTIVTPDYIFQFQISTGEYVRISVPDSKPIKINVPDQVGILYWEILKIYMEMRGKSGWEYNYYLFNIAHYIGDLSQPLHNFPHGNEPASDGHIYSDVGIWAKNNHRAFDNILELSFPLDKNTEKKFNSWISVPSITSPNDLKREISKVANHSITLANKCYSENRIMSKEEALRQLAMSASLVMAIIASAKTIPQK